jgi:hypothetical protein
MLGENMHPCLSTVLAWLQKNEWLALWVEGLALLAIFFWDRKDHKEDHKETIEQMKIMSRNAVAAETAANAAKRSAEVAEMALKVVERADVMLDAVSLTMRTAQALHTNVPLSPYSRVSMELRNFGRTRADNVRCNINLIIPGVEQSERVPPDPFVIGPGASQTVMFRTFKESLTEKTYKDIESGAIDLKFAGTVSYEDIFGESHSVTCKGLLDPHTGNFFLGERDPRKES